MSKKTKRWLIIATSLVLIGGIIFGGAMTVLKWDFSKLSTSKYKTNTYKINNEFSSISIKAKTADIIFVVSDNKECKVVCYEEEKAKHSVAVQNGTLTINSVDDRKWYEYIGINIVTPKITVYLPDSEYEKLNIKNSTGDIEIAKDFTFKNIDIEASTGDVKNYASAAELIKIKTNTGTILLEDISAGALELSVSTGKTTAKSVTCHGNITTFVSTGDTHLENITCNSLISNGSTGDISLKKVIAEEKFTIERSTGDVIFDNCDSAELFVKTDTGDVTGTLLSDKVFLVETDTGSIDVPKSINGGKCEIITDTGDVKVSVK